MNPTSPTPAELGRTLVEPWLSQYKQWLWYKLTMAEGGTPARHEEPWAHGHLRGATRLLAPGRLLRHGLLHCYAVPAHPGLGAPACSHFVAGMRAAQYPRSAWLPAMHLRLEYGATAHAAWFSGELELSPRGLHHEQLRSLHDLATKVYQAVDFAPLRRFTAGHEAPLFVLRPPQLGQVHGFWFNRLVVGRDGLFEELFAFVQDVGTLYGNTCVALLRLYAAQTPPPRQYQQEQFSLAAGAAPNLVRGPEFYPGLAGAPLSAAFRARLWPLAARSAC